MTERDADSPPAMKDEQGPHPIAGAWREPLRQIVRALVQGDYALSTPIAGVEQVPTKTAEQMRDYIAEYGETLVELPDETWDTSEAQWSGAHWELLVDLWTAEEGPSDLVLSCTVNETDDGYRFTVDLVYVP